MTRPTIPDWKERRSYKDIRYETAEGIAKITINRPEVRNAFRPPDGLRDDATPSRTRARTGEVGVIILTGEGKDAFCSGGDQKVRGDAGYVGDDGVPRLNVLDLQREIRTLPKPVIAMVAGYAIGGGHVLHRRLRPDHRRRQRRLRPDRAARSAASTAATAPATWPASSGRRRRARSGTSAASTTRRRRSTWDWSTTVVPLDRLEEETVEWAGRSSATSPIAIRCLKAAFNADSDGQAGIQELAGNATLLFYMTEEAQEGRNAFIEKRPPDFTKFPRLP